MKDDRKLPADVTIKRKKGGFPSSETPNLPYAEWLQNLRIVGTNGMGITPKNTSALFFAFFTIIGGRRSASPTRN